jgi:hypothetical protein
MKVGSIVKRSDEKPSQEEQTLLPTIYGLIIEEGQDRFSVDLAKVWWLGYKGRKADNPHWVVKSLLEKV